MLYSTRDFPAKFFEPWEPDPISSLDTFIRLINLTFSRWSNKDVQYAWRGVVNANWPLHSTLYRRMIWTYASLTEEMHLQRIEKEILADAHRWGLHYSGQSHLPILYELAMLQHFGVPTRLIDITFNPLIALYFAVEDQKGDFGRSSYEEVDGRIFVFDVSSRTINERSKQERAWEDSYDRFLGQSSNRRLEGILLGMASSTHSRKVCSPTKRIHIWWCSSYYRCQSKEDILAESVGW